MNLERKNIHMNKIIKNEMFTFYVNHESGISDSQEIDSVISQHENISVDNVSIRGNQLLINGTISYGIMYYTTEDSRAGGQEGEILFEENFKINDLDDNCNVNVNLVPVSSSVRLIDRKNYIYKAQVMAWVTVEKLEDMETVCDIDSDNVMKKYEEVRCLSIVAGRNETFRINERLSVPSGKPSVDKIIWNDIKIKSVSTRMLDGMVNVSGELKVFVIYTQEDESGPVGWIDSVVNFGGNIEIPEAKEEYVSYIDTYLHNVEIDSEMNVDNEMRDIALGALLKLNIKIYEENNLKVLEDVYAPDTNLVPVIENKKYQQLLVKNQSRTKNVVKINLDKNKGNILQICNNDAEVKIENVIISNNGLKVSGKIKASVIYISSDDEHPICIKQQEEEFRHMIDADGISDGDQYYINWRIEQISANMISTEQVEVKSVIALETIVFREERGDFISDIDERPIDVEAINDAPTIKGYIVRKGDTLWTLAKNNYTTIENIMKVNNLTSDNIKQGDRLLIVKSCQ